MRVPATEWPVVPKTMRPRPLYVAELVNDEDMEELVTKGWQVVDVRLLPNVSIAERQACVLAWFEGLRNGSLTSSGGLLDVLEAESKACGLTSMKQAPDKPKELADDTLDAILGGVINKRPSRHK